MNSNRRWGVGLFAIFAALFVLAARFLVVTQGIWPEGTPQEILDVDAGLRVFNWGLGAFAAFGCFTAIAIYLRPRMGWIAFAVLLSSTSVFLAVAQLLSAGEAFDVDWSPVIASAVFAVLAWQRAIKEGRVNA